MARLISSALRSLIRSVVPKRRRHDRRPSQSPLGRRPGSVEMSPGPSNVQRVAARLPRGRVGRECPHRRRPLPRWPALAAAPPAPCDRADPASGRRPAYRRRLCARPPQQEDEYDADAEAEAYEDEGRMESTNKRRTRTRTTTRRSTGSPYRRKTRRGRLAGTTPGRHLPHLEGSHRGSTVQTAPAERNGARHKPAKELGPNDFYIRLKTAFVRRALRLCKGAPLSVLNCLWST